MNRADESADTAAVSAPAPLDAGFVLHGGPWPAPPAGLRLHTLFEQRCDALAADGRPDWPAVDGPRGRVGYRALDALANRLARHLRAGGLRAGQRVALLLDRSAASYAAMLAVLKLHAAYVPLDASFPADRVAYILEDAEVDLVVAQRSGSLALDGSPVPVVWLDDADVEAAIAARPGHRLSVAEPGLPDDGLCYVIYTSGSTGRPKGVPISHAQVVNFVQIAAARYGYTADDRVYQGLTLAFDFAVEEIWVPLAVGATLLPNDSGVSLLGEDLAAFLRRWRASALCAVPTLLATLETALPALRLVITSGEACPRDLVARWHAPGRRLLNAYGPTETTVTATLGLPRPDRPVTIGRPLPSYAVVILAPGQAQALPRGTEGEIGLAGIGVASGYLNREEQTRRAFIPDFLGIEGNASGRIYRTGDLGRINDDGEVEYLGRIDTQVKLRGYRIELAEIESLLLECPAVAQAVVNPWEPAPGQIELAAYYTVAPGHDDPGAALLQARLRDRLPPYMVPAWFEALERMPMLASDKADRHALPVPRTARQTQGAHVAPRPGLETTLARPLASLLGLETVSAQAHFFHELGASSLLMARYGAALRQALGGARPAMADLYAHPTVAQLARWLAATPAEAPVPGNTSDAAPTEAPHVAPAWAHVGCGAAQAVLLAGLATAHAGAWWHAMLWVGEADASVDAYLRAVGFASAWLLASLLLPVAWKWVALGRVQPGVLPAWSLAYLRWWSTRLLIQTSPAALFRGTPLLVAWLRLLGARVAWTAHLAMRRLPACPDLLTVGDEAVINAHAQLDTCTARGGRMHLGPVRIGARAEVGDGCLVDIHATLEADARLAPSTTVAAGQRLAAGEWHGNPARPAPPGTLAPPAAAAAARPGGMRRAGFALAHLALWCGLLLPLPLLVDIAALRAEAADPVVVAAVVGLGWAAVLLGHLALTVLATRLLEPWLQAGRHYRLYGWHHALLRIVQSVGNAKRFNELFGDASAIVHYLAALGWRQPQRLQTGSNFGMAQQHDVARLCTAGSGAIVSDGLVMLNARFSARGFDLAPSSIGAQSFLGNAIFMPPGAAVGDDCLLATKVAVPLAGPRREGVGLLGSPAFEIPRAGAVADGAPRVTAALRDARLPAKNRSNAAGMAWLLASQCTLVGALALAWTSLDGRAAVALFLPMAVAITLAWRVVQDAAVRGFRPLRAMSCTLYDPAFWRHERYWKLGLAADHPLMELLAGTPMRAWLWRSLGVKVGRQLLDDGASLTERPLVTLGHHVTLGAMSTLQAHSLEDGVFTSAPIVLGDAVSVGPRAYVHYGTRLDARAEVAPDAFVMKGEALAAGSRWAGNPARPLR